MELRYRGQIYSASLSQVRTLASAQKARFLGQDYILRHPTKIFPSQLGLKKYRGVAY